MLLIWAKVIVTLIPSVTLDRSSSLNWIYKGWKRERTTFLTITVQWQQRTSKKHDYDSFKHISKRIIPLSLIVCIKLKNTNRKHFCKTGRPAVTFSARYNSKHFICLFFYHKNMNIQFLYNKHQKTKDIKPKTYFCSLKYIFQRTTVFFVHTMKIRGITKMVQ